MREKGKTKKRVLIPVIAASIILSLTMLFGAYVSDYYRAPEEVQTMLNDLAHTIPVTVHEDYIIMSPKGATTGIIFYPGAKVEYEAYVPVLGQLAEQGIAVILLKMPCNMAIFDWNAAKKVMNWNPEIEDWYIAGHSMGGAMAGSFAAKNADRIKGVIFLAAFTTSDLSDTGLRVLSIYGSEDRVLGHETYQKNTANLPADYSEVIIQGGNHAQFGDYGSQRGDGTARISKEVQWKETAKTILNWVVSNE